MTMDCRHELECPFDDRLLGAGADDVGRSSFTKEEGERVDDHRFSRAGLTRQNVETWLEWERDVGDDGQVTNAQFRKHYFRVRSLKSPQCSFFRSRLKKLSGPSRTRRMGRSARRTSRRSPGEIGVPTWPSKDTRTSSLHGGIGWIVTTAVAGKTSGRTARVCGQMAVTTRATPPLWTTTSFSTSGSTLPAPPLAPLPVIDVCSASLCSVVYARRTTE